MDRYTVFNRLSFPMLWMMPNLKDYLAFCTHCFTLSDSPISGSPQHLTVVATLVRLSATTEECATTGPVSAHPLTLDMTAATQSLTYQVSSVSFRFMLSFARSVAT